jgi:thiamine biosynthesis protein ThiS
MRLVVNGEEKSIDESATLAELLDSFALDPRRVAIEVNEQLVRRALYAETPLSEGDRIEIVTLVGGG